MEILRKILSWIDNFTKWQGYFLAPFCTTLIIMVILDVATRQSGNPVGWAWDIEWFHWAFLMTGAMGYAFLRDQHVRIDLLTTRFPPRTQAGMMAFSYGVVVIPLMVMVGIYSWDFVMRSVRVQEVIYTTFNWPVWPIKGFLLIGVCLMLPQSFAQLVRSTYLAIKGKAL